MKKFLPFSLTLCGVAALVTVAVHAANPPAPAAKPEGKPAGRPGLSAEQQTKLDGLREQMKAVLTPEQRQKMTAMRGQFRRGHGSDRRSPQRFGHHRAGPQQRFGHHPGEGRQVRHHAARGHAMKMKHRRAHRAEKLGLTDDQRAKMRQIAFQNREKAIGLRQDRRKEMESVLTPEQKATAQKLKEHRGRRGPGR